MIPFWKMHGCGNDFIVVESTVLAAPLRPDTVRSWVDRRCGVGCDQVLVIDPPASDRLPRMTVFNADGSQGKQCGNGLRCVAWFLQQRYPALGAAFQVESSSGAHEVEIHNAQDIAVKLGVPGRVQQRRVVLDGEQIPQLTCVDVGNPHAVCWVEDVDHVPLHRWGKALNGPDGFNGGINVECASVLESCHARMRVWERGSGETLACGSGACAVMVAGRSEGLFDSTVTLDLPGGRLVVQWSRAQDPVVLSGPVAVVFQGEIPIAQ